MALQLAKWRFTVAEYDQMGQAGILSENDRVELIDGEVIQMAAIGLKHAAQVVRCTDLFAQRVGALVQVSVQNPIRLGEHSEPEPDLVLRRPRPDYYAARPTTPEDILLLVEVADSSLEYDRGVKIPLYARHGIRETWLINLNDATITAYRAPSPDGYQTIQIARRGDQISLLVFPEVVLHLEDVLV